MARRDGSWPSPSFAGAWHPCRKGSWQGLPLAASPSCRLAISGSSALTAPAGKMKVAKRKMVRTTGSCRT
jgi:hypothetical protein